MNDGPASARTDPDDPYGEHEPPPRDPFAHLDTRSEIDDLYGPIIDGDDPEAMDEWWWRIIRKVIA
jgi:hypothetical protein